MAKAYLIGLNTSNISQMKNTNFKKIAIGVNEGAKSEHERSLNAKRSDLRELSDYVNRFIEIDDYTLLFQDFKNTFRERFAEKFAKQFPNLVSQQKQLELVDCDINKIDALSDAIERNKIALDKDLNATEKVDFNIYTKSEDENRLYKTLSAIADNYAELKKNGVNVFPMAIVNGTSQALRYDFASQRLKPNIAIFSPNYQRR
jgi:iron-sulfur cluster repair protein YtfE (RIC family)